MFRRPGRPTLVLIVIALIGAPIWFAPAADASDVYVGEIRMYGFSFAPRNFAHCNGQILQVIQYTTLFALIGTTYGGDGRITFALPDIRGRSVVHPGQGPGLSNIQWGQRSGVETTTLTVSNMPSHVHQAILHATSTDGNEEGPANHFLAGDPREDQYSNAPAPNVTMNMACITMQPSGSGQAFGVRDPYIAIYYSIALTGTFPPRN